jgi:hypothetical protein
MILQKTDEYSQIQEENLSNELCPCPAAKLKEGRRRRRRREKKELEATWRCQQQNNSKTTTTKCEFLPSATMMDNQPI